MKAYIIIKDREIDVLCHTSLKESCLRAGVSYDSALRGKRCWSSGNRLLEIKELEIIKIKGRGKK